MSALLSPAMESVVRSLARPGTLIVLGFDGTLAPIVGDRNAATLSRRTRAVVGRLARLYPVAVLSGRAAEDVRSRLLPGAAVVLGKKVVNLLPDGAGSRGELTRAAAPRSSPRPSPDPKIDLLGPVLGFMKELWALEQGLNSRSKAMLSNHGVTGPQRLVVRIVSRLGPISPAQLARMLHIHRSSVTRLVRKLEARRIIRRTPDPRFPRRFLLELGARGGRVERLRAQTVESAVEAALRSATAQDVAATRGIIALVARRLMAKR